MGAIRTEKQALAHWNMVKAKALSIRTVDDVETEAQRVKRMKALEKDYIKWFEYYFPNYAKKPCAWFHKALAKKIIKKKRIKILAEWYRSAAKSVHIDMGIPLFLYFVLHELKFMLLVGENSDKAAQLLSNIQAQIQFNPRLIRDYGSRYQYGDWAEGDFSTSDGAHFMSIGFLENPRGAREAENRPDYIVVDDVDNKRHVNNDRLMRQAVDFITGDVWGCFDSDDDSTERFVYANNNFHKNSITNRLKNYFIEAKAKAKQYDEEDVFEVMTVCAVKNLNTFEPEWPEKTSADYWRHKFDTTPYRSFMREYMHKHIEDGAVFKNEDIIWGQMLPLNQYDTLCFYGDLSYKDAADYKGMVLVGKYKRQFHIIYAYLRRGSRAKCAEWLYDLYEDKHLHRYNIKYKIEGLFAMDEFVNDFDIEGDKRGFYIPVVADKRGKADKYERIESMSGYFERHNMIFNEDLRNNPDMADLVDQFLAFEKGSKANDDGPDAVHGACKELYTLERSDIGKIKVTTRQEKISHNKNRF